MKLIADSGSTKTDWRLIDDEGQIHQAKTEGLNPFFKTTMDCSETLEEVLLPQFKFPSLLKKVDLEIHFYGAGCSSAAKCLVVERAFKQVFNKATVEIEHDLLGAARALCGHSPGIAAILGTGSNSCYYDGKEVVQNVTALGYILGDEGSGAYIGKKLIKDYLDKELPESVVERFEKRFDFTKDEILDKVYQDSLPNRFLASFSKWVYQIRDKEEYAQELISWSIGAFLDKHICKYKNHKEVELNVVGSVGYFHSRTLKVLAEERGIKVGKVLETPIAGLVLYHTGQI